MGERGGISRESVDSLCRDGADTPYMIIIIIIIIIIMLHSTEMKGSG